MSRPRYIVVLAVIFLMLHVPAAAAGQVEIDTTLSGPFSLTDHNGQPVTDRDFRGRYMLVFFGYTSCPDVCPTQLQIMGRAMGLMGAAAEEVQPIFISVDPERDAKILQDYVLHFHQRMLGLTGTAQQVAESAQAYGAYYVKILDANNDDPQSYLINHTAYIYLLGPDGRFRAAFDPGSGAEALVAGILPYLE